jgi:Zn-dependent protease
MLATVDLHNPILWAVFIGWIMSVVLHEFGHGLAAYFGGDYTIRERGGLTLNPLQYIDPVYSLLFPAVIFLMGGIPLPGGVTYIRRDLIRNRFWQVMVSAAGPLMNFLIFLALVLPFHPRIGWIDASKFDPGGDIPNGYLFMGAMAWMQMLAVLFNLMPVPPLDGFQMVSQFLPLETRRALMAPAVRQGVFILFFIALSAPGVFDHFHAGVVHTLRALKFDDDTIRFFLSCYSKALFQ